MDKILIVYKKYLYTKGKKKENFNTKNLLVSPSCGLTCL